MSKLKQKYLRKLKHKAVQVNQEYEETLEIFNLAKVEFVTHILEYCQKNKTPSPLTDSKTDEKESSKEEEEIFSEKEVKNVYKQIAISTHPDKLGKLNEEDKEEKTALFKKAAEAKDTKNLNELTQIALELKINLSELKYAQLELLEQQVVEKERKIEEMHQDIAWHWYYLNSKQRERIISVICDKPLGPGGHPLAD